MSRTLTLQIDDAVYDGICNLVTEHKVGQFVESLLRPYAFASLEEGYKAMAADVEQEQEATEWCNALIKDVAP